MNHIKKTECLEKYLKTKERNEKKKRQICTLYASCMHDNKTAERGKENIRYN
jgi:hypothetical protein